MKKLFFLPLLVISSFCFSQKVMLEIKGMPESGTGVEVFSFSWGASNPAILTPGGQQAGKVSVSSFNMMKHQDKTSVKLIEAVTKGKHFAEAVITQTDKQGTPTFRYTLLGVLVESVQYSHSSCGKDDCRFATESLSLSAAKWRWEDLLNQQTYEFNLATNTSL